MQYTGEWGTLMKKSIVCLLIAVTLLSLSVTLIPNGLAQTANIKVLSYSYHVDNVNNMLIVYGEVQNQGSSIMSNVVLSGSVYSASGIDLQDGNGNAYAIFLVPQQKVPFEIDFNAPKTSDGSWSSAIISKIDFSIAQAIATTSYPYPDVKITSESYSIDTTVNASGTYWATCNLQNTGSQTAQNIFVVGTFYNSSGATVSGGWSARINSLAPSATASVKVGAFEINMSSVTPDRKITSYSLVVQPASPTSQGSPPDASAYTFNSNSSPQTSSTPTNATPTPTGQSANNGVSNSSNASNQWLIYVGIIVIIVVAAVAAIKTFPKRKSAESKKASAGTSAKATSKKPQGKNSRRNP